jgi:RimJ/RimL family protein N-acetyltransferase
MLVVGDQTMVNWVRDRMPEYVDGFGKDARCIGVLNESGLLIAAVVYTNFNDTNIELTIASISPKWATKGHIQGILSYPFDQLGCRRVTAVTARDNNHVRTFLKRLGFMHEGTLHDFLPTSDAVVYGMTKRYYLRSKWNGISNGKKATQSTKFAAATTSAAG